jgi:hypothetical protein
VCRSDIGELDSTELAEVSRVARANYLQGCNAMAKRTVSRLTAIFTTFAVFTWLVGSLPAQTSESSNRPGNSTAADEGSAPTPPDSTAYDLRYKLSSGDVLRYDVTHRASIRSTIDQTTQAAQTKTDSVKLWKITDVLPNGDIEVMNVVERVHMVNQLPDHDPTEYDSARDITPPPGFEDAAKAVGVPLSVVRITPRGKVIARDLKIRQQSVEEDAPVVLRLPNKPVTIGETWDEPFEVKVALESGGTKSVQTRRRHKLTGVSNGIATIQVTYQVLSPIDATAECQLVQRLMEGDVKFDIDAGRVVSQQMDIDKRILGFAGPTSSMHYIMRMEEKLADTVTPKVTTTGQPKAAPPKPSIKSTPPSSMREDRSSSRPGTRTRANRR